MTLKENNQEELIIDKCLIVDDKFDEVKDIIFKLNDYAISTDYRKDLLDDGVRIDSNTQLVILDLYMSHSQDSFDNALQSVGVLNDKIEGPFFLLIWTKHEDEFERFSEQICEKWSNKNYKNFPLDIRMLSARKIKGEQNEKIIEDAVGSIIQYIYEISEKYTNIYHYMKLTKIFQKKSTIFWKIFKADILKNKITHQEFSKYYENVLGQAFNNFDRSFNYEKSGKGFLNVHTKFFEQELTVNRINYKTDDNELDNRFKKEINSKLIIRGFTDSKPENGLPGLIYKVRKKEKIKIQEFWKNFFETITLSGIKMSPSESLKYNFFNLGTLFKKGDKNKKQLDILLQTSYAQIKDSEKFEYLRKMRKKSFKNSKTINEILEDILKSKIKTGKLVITPYCDFAQGKKNNVLYLPILIVEDNFDNRKKQFKSNVKFQNLYNGKYIAYIASMYHVCDLESLGQQTYPFYLSKEYVNEIQINVANNISRIGTTILE